jgi:hypothetical protein
MSACNSCGAVHQQGSYCPDCGALVPRDELPLAHAEEAKSGLLVSRPGQSPDGTIMSRFTESLKIAPGAPSPSVRLWIVIGLLAAVGALLTGVTLYLVVETLPLYGDGGLGVAIATFILLVLTTPLIFGLGLLYLARRIQQGDRLARVFAIVTCAAVALACLLTGDRDVGFVLTALLAIGVIVMLTLDPVVRAHFSGEDARYANEPIPVVAARVLMVVVAACDVLVAVSFFVLAPYAGGLVIWGVVIAAIAISVFVLSRQLAVGNSTARVLTTLLAAAYFLVALLAGHGAPGVILPVALALSIVGLLWLPSKSRSYFGRLERPTMPVLLAFESALDRAADRVTTGFVTATATAHGEEE